MNSSEVKETPEEFEKNKKALNDKVGKLSMSIRNGNTGWLKGEGMCEWCGAYKAEYNLDLKCGTHRECWLCWK